MYYRHGAGAGHTDRIMTYVLGETLKFQFTGCSQNVAASEIKEGCMSITSLLQQAADYGGRSYLVLTFPLKPCLGDQC